MSNVRLHKSNEKIASMGLRGDVSEVSALWRAAPWRVRVYLVLSLVLASTSVASLSETVFKWKGFIQDAIAFYRVWIGQPITQAIAHAFKLQLPGEFADHFAVSAILLVAVLRKIYFTRKTWGGAIAAGALQIAAYSAYLVGVAIGQLPSQSWVAAGFYGLMLLQGLVYFRGATRLLWVSYLLILLISTQS